MPHLTSKISKRCRVVGGKVVCKPKRKRLRIGKVGSLNVSFS